MTVEELPHHSIRVDRSTLGSEIARLFEQDKALPGVIVTGGDAPPSLVARHRFYQRLGRLYGVEIYMPRSIAFFLESGVEPQLVVAASLPVQLAVVSCLERGDQVYDPFLVLLPGGEVRLITFESLILRQTELLSVAQVEAQAQKTMALAASQAKSEFLAVMSHELRTPLTAIIGYGEIVLEDVQAGCLDEVTPRVQNIVSAGLHLLQMINGILDLAKIEAGKTDLAQEVFPVAAFVEELTGTLAPLVKKNGNEFRLEMDSELGDLIADRLKLKQCLLNLLGNAAKFTEQGCISLRVSRATTAGRPWIAFEVADTGIGMTETQMQQLFQPFYQADSSISRRFGGTGLGLSLSKRYCEMMGGTLTVRSVPEQGSTFAIQLPLGVDVASAAEPEPPRLDAVPDKPRKKQTQRVRRKVAA